MRTTFIVGRLTPRTSELVLVGESSARPIPGPWTLKAVVRVLGPDPEGPLSLPGWTTP